MDVRDGSKGPLLIEVVKRRVVGRNHRRQEGHPEVLVVIRYRDRENRRVVKTDYYLSNASADVELTEFARVAKAEHRIEECLQRAKSEAGSGRLRGSQLERLAASPNALSDRRLVPGGRNPAGEKNGRLRLPSHKSAKASPKSYDAIRGCATSVSHPTRMPTTSGTQRTSPLVPLEAA